MLDALNKAIFGAPLTASAGGVRLSLLGHAVPERYQHPQMTAVRVLAGECADLPDLPAPAEVAS